MLEGSSSESLNFEGFLQGNDQDEPKLRNEKINPAGTNAESESTGQPMKDNRASRRTVMMFWGLLVTPMGDGTYKRVGMAIIYPCVIEQMDVAYGQIRIH